MYKLLKTQEWDKCPIKEHHTEGVCLVCPCYHKEIQQEDTTWELVCLYKTQNQHPNIKLIFWDCEQSFYVIYILYSKICFVTVP